MPETAAPTWFVERGIGEVRALLLERDEPIAAKLYWPGELYAGGIVDAKLASKPSGKARGVAVARNGTEILVDRLPRDLTEGGHVSIAITRGPIAERGRFKRAQGRIADGTTTASVFDDATEIRRFPSSAWEDVWTSASSGEVAFSGGSLLFSVTPAMTLIDIDGDLPPRELSIAAVPHIAHWLRLFDLGGSIGIDFPTLGTKADRKALDAALEQALADWPHERTAMNGFGFVQIVARLEGPSLLHRFATSRSGASARMFLRRAEMLDGAGVTLLTVHPALERQLRTEWIDELSRRTGRPIRVKTAPGLAIDSASAQIVPHDE